MKKLLYLVVLFTAIVNNAHTQSTGGFVKDSMPGCQAEFGYYYNDSIWTFAEAYPYQFNDYSTGNVTSWLWDFGNGMTSTIKDPLFFYKFPGDTVTVCLTITTSDNCTSTSCKSFVVSSPSTPPDCYASFYMYQDSFVDCICYRFQGFSNNEAASWHWDFGDGTVSEEYNPLHHFPADGSYNVCLTVTQADGQSCNYCKPVYSGADTIPTDCRNSYEVETLESYPPQYHFVPYASDSVDWYYWDFGDGQGTYERSPVHTYKYSGYYIVCLVTKTLTGCKSESCITEYYTGESKQCRASWEKYPAPEKGTKPDSLPNLCSTCYVFHDYSEGAPVSWHWTFGDGTESFEQNPVHSFPGPEIYTVCLEILTADSCSSTFCDSVYVGIQEPCSLYGTVVDYTGLDGCGLVIQLDNGELLEPLQIVPEFTIKDGQRVILSYTEIPSASICMVGKVVRIDCIREVSACRAAFWHYDLPWVSSLPPIYQFESDTSQPILSWQWDLGDGTVVKEKSPMHRYEYSGYYTVCLTIITAEGCSDTYCETAYYEGKNQQPGLCNYRLSIQTEMIIGSVYSCEGSASARLLDDQGNEARAQSYLWSTGSSECCISGLCTNTEYQVTVTDPDGCSITGSFLYYSSGSVPGDTAWTNWNYEKRGNNFSFNVPEYQEDYSCIWDFGDGTVAEGFNVYHTYSEKGEYVVVMTVYDSEGVLVLRREFTVNTGEPTGITEPSGSEGVTVYPVPASDVLYIAGSLVSAQSATLRVFSASGQLIMTKEFHALDGPVTLSLDVSDLPAGAYYGILVSDSSGNRTFRFIK